MSFFSRGEDMSVCIDARPTENGSLDRVVLQDDRTGRQTVIVDCERNIVGLTAEWIDPRYTKDLIFSPCARYRKALYGLHIDTFHDGKAVVSWCIQPDGRYWEDEDGFGGTSDVEIELYSLIDRQGRFCLPFLWFAGESFREIERQLRELDDKIDIGGRLHW